MNKLIFGLLSVLIISTFANTFDEFTEIRPNANIILNFINLSDLNLNFVGCKIFGIMNNDPNFSLNYGENEEFIFTQVSDNYKKIYGNEMVHTMSVITIRN